MGFQLPGQPAPKVGALCTVNPERGLDIPEGGWPIVTARRRVLVVGGGVGGMMAAITAADRGHEVLLVEKSERLGGTIGFTDHDPYKVDYKNYKDLLIRRVKDRGIKLALGTEVSASQIDGFAPDVIIAAVGADAKKPALEGLENAVHALDAYDPSFRCGRRVVVVGGSNHAAETGVYLAARDDVEKVTVLRVNAEGVTDPRAVNIIRRKMIADGIGIVDDERFVRIEPGCVVTDKDRYEADTIVYHLGMEPRKDTLTRISEWAGGIPVVAVGDCKAARVVANAIREGYVASMEIS